jgi:hypothetical protein
MTTDAAAVASIEAATRELRLPGIRLHAARLAAEAQRAKATYLGFLADALSVEVDDRVERRRSRRIHEARFPGSSGSPTSTSTSPPPSARPRSPLSPPAVTSTPATRSCCSATPAPARPIC